MPIGIQLATKLGIATEETNHREFVTIGRLPLSQCKEAVEVYVLVHNQEVSAYLRDNEEELNKPENAEWLAKIPTHLLLTYDEYQHALSIMPQLEREQANISAQRAILEHMESSGALAEVKAAMTRIRKTEAGSSPAYRNSDLGVSAEVHKQTGAYQRDKQIIADTKWLYGNFEKMGIDTQRREVLLNHLYGFKVVNFSQDYNRKKHTDNWHGYLGYLLENESELMEEILVEDVPVSILEQDRQRHTYVVGGTGSGKSELIKVLVHRYLVNHTDKATVVLDPHGDMVRQIARFREFQNPERLLYLDPLLQNGQTFTINPLQPPAGSTRQEREVIAQQLAGAFEELLKGSAGATLSVNMRALLMPCLLVLLDEGNRSLKDLQTFLNDDHNGQLVGLGKKSPRPAIARFFAREFGDKNFSPTKQSLRTKLQSLFNSEVFYNLINGPSSIDLERAIAERKVILFNLAKGTIGPEASEAFGRFIIALLQGLALRRQTVETKERVPVHLFIDECQNYIGASTTTILEEARKYGLHLTLAQQVAGRGMGPEMRTVVLNNTAVKIVGRTAEDQRMAKLLGLELGNVQDLKVGQFYAKAGNGETFRFDAAKDLLENKNDMGDSAWHAVQAAVIRRHYRRAGNSTEPTAPQTAAEAISGRLDLA
mgnify:CR=1 FL=1|jgi:hypothetical protein